MMETLGNVDWLGVALALGALVVGWVILRFVLRLTLKVFACGCVVLLALAGLAFLWVDWEQIAVWFQ